jgi:hypothetical protein
MDNDFLLKIVHNNYPDEEIKAAFTQITSKDVAERFDYFISSLEASPKIMSLADRLLAKLEQEDVKGWVMKLVEYQRSTDADVREVTTFIAVNKISEQELIDNIEALLDYPTLGDKDVVRLIEVLLLSIDPKKLECKIDFLKNKKHPNLRSRRLVDRLLKNITKPPRPEKIEEIVAMILS